MRHVRLFWAAAGLQMAENRREPSNLTVLVTTPVYAALFLSLGAHTGSEVATLSAVFAPAMMSLWFMAVSFGGDVIRNERIEGTLEALVAAPAKLPVLIAGRLAPVGLIGLLCFAESYAVAVLGFGVSVTVPHPWVLLFTIGLTVVAIVTTASALAGLFVFSRKVITFQNLLTYPFYILGGIMVPVALYPPVIQVLSHVVFLSWASDLLRDSTGTAPVAGWPGRELVIVLLGAVAWVWGWWLLNRIVERIRSTGTVTAS